MNYNYDNIYMLRLHRNEAEYYKSPKILIKHSNETAEITTNTSYTLRIPDHLDHHSKSPIITWRRQEQSKWRMTPLYTIRQYLEYTEPQYSPWMEKWLNIYPNQYRAANQVVDCLTNGFQKVILTAEMQSGKTGTVRYIVHSLLHLSGPDYDATWEERLTPDRVYFICGMNDNDLRQQAITEFQGYIPEENIMFSRQLQTWNRDLPNRRNSVQVVIIDESHYASLVNSQVDKFLKTVEHCQPYEISVSATAMAEIATSQRLDKAIIYLHPGEGYYSIRDLFDRDLIKQAANISAQLNHRINNDDFVNLISEEYESQCERDECKYNIVRLPSQWHYQDLQDEIDQLDMNIKYIHFHSCNEDHTIAQIRDFNHLIAEEPECFTIIWIYGSLRAGKQLNTEHLGFVHDTAHSSPDTIAQSLLGRILGYGKAKHYVRCYTDLTSAKLMYKWMNSLYDITKIPKGSRSIKNGYNGQIRRWDLHPPIAIHLDQDLRSHFRALKQRHGNRYPYKYQLFDCLVEVADGLIQPEVERILSEYKPGRCGGLMVLTEKNTRRSFSEHWCQNYRCFRLEQPVRGFDVFQPGKYFYVYLNLNINSPEYGCALITYKEYINSATGSEHVLVNNSSRFSITS